MQNVPFFTLVLILKEDNESFLSSTLQSIRCQKIENFELIVIDGRKNQDSKFSYLLEEPFVSHYYNAWDLRSFALYNKGIALSSGRYIHFLEPGEFYIFDKTLCAIKREIENHYNPDLINTGYVVRHYMSPSENVIVPITLKQLYEGKAPSNLQPLWFRRGFLENIGGFYPYFENHSLDVLCRIYLQTNLKVAFLPRILVDYEYTVLAASKIFRCYLEAFAIQLFHFGPRLSLFFWLKRNAFQMIVWFARTLKSSLIGKTYKYRY